MMRTVFLICLCLGCMACAQQGSEAPPAPVQPGAVLGHRTVQHGGYTLQVYIDKPAGAVLDVIVAYHGTIGSDAQLQSATQMVAEKVRQITSRPQVAIISVGYPQQGRIVGQSMAEAEAGLLWSRDVAPQVLQFSLGKLYLLGHSQGGYVVTRLATQYRTDGVVANAPGPLNLQYRCQLEADGVAPPTQVCQLLAQQLGPPAHNAAGYLQPSLLTYTRGYRSDVLFVQGLADSPIQLASWGAFKDSVQACTNCQQRSFIDVAGAGHGALFEDAATQLAYNNFLNR